MKTILSLFVTFLLATDLLAQNHTPASNFWQPIPRNYQVKHALEIESLVPMFFTGGYHFALGYRYKKFRLRASIINGGTYNAETAGIKNNSANFKRYYTTSLGIFFGYNVWKNLELYTYLKFHTFRITQKSTGIQKDIKSTDTGLGLSYQFFIGGRFYIQPSMHLYLRKDNSVDFSGVTYNIPNADISPVVRIGYRICKKY